MVRTYRILVTGQFDRLVPTAREQLLAEQPNHDVFVSAFVPEGFFSYSTALTRFTLRYLLDLDEGSAAQTDAAAALEGELRASEYLNESNIPFKSLSVSVTCMQDVKGPRRPAQRSV